MIQWFQLLDHLTLHFSHKIQNPNTALIYHNKFLRGLDLSSQLETTKPIPLKSGSSVPWGHRRRRYAPWRRGPAMWTSRPSRYECLRTRECHPDHAKEAHLLISWASHLGKSSLFPTFLYCSHKLHFHPFMIKSTIRSVRKIKKIELIEKLGSGLFCKASQSIWF